jgi:hypothetical protein
MKNDYGSRELWLVREHMQSNRLSKSLVELVKCRYVIPWCGVLLERLVITQLIRILLLYCHDWSQASSQKSAVGFHLNRFSPVHIFTKSFWNEYFPQYLFSKAAWLFTDYAVGVQFRSVQDFSLRNNVQTGSEAHPTSCPMGTGGHFPRGKATGVCS